jgi:hypothetical protein
VNATAGADEVDRLYRAYIAMLPEKRRLNDELTATEKAIPEWARLGPKYLAPDGTFHGERVYWPRDVTMTPAPWLDKICRPGPDDLRQQYENFLTNEFTATYQSCLTEADALRWYRRQLRALVARQHAQKAEEDRVGYHKLEAAYDAFCDKVWEPERQLKRLAPTVNSAAALILMKADIEYRKDQYADVVDATMLHHLMPALSGMIREHVEHLLSSIDEERLTTLYGMPFMS